MGVKRQDNNSGGGEVDNAQDNIRNAPVTVRSDNAWRRSFDRSRAQIA